MGTLYYDNAENRVKFPCNPVNRKDTTEKTCFLTRGLTKGQRESPSRSAISIAWVHDTNFQKFPRRTETAIASIAGRSPAFCELSKI